MRSGAPAPDLRIVPLEKRMPREAFDCGVPALNDYLRQRALQDARRGAASVWAAVDASGAIAGFYTLSMAGVLLTGLPEDLRRKMPRYPSVPAIRLGRLAVSKDKQGQGIGAFLLMDAMRRALENPVAWMAYLVDAKDDSAVRFYRQYGFQSFKDSPNRLYLMRNTIEDLFR